MYDVGVGAGKYYSVNVPLKDGIDDEGVLIYIYIYIYIYICVCVCTEYICSEYICTEYICTEYICTEYIYIYIYILCSHSYGSVFSSLSSIHILIHTPGYSTSYP